MPTPPPLPIASSASAGWVASTCPRWTASPRSTSSRSPSRRPDAMDAAATLRPAAARYANVGDALAHPGLEACIVATPTPTPSRRRRGGAGGRAARAVREAAVARRGARRPSRRHRRRARPRAADRVLAALLTAVADGQAAPRPHEHRDAPPAPAGAVGRRPAPAGVLRPGGEWRPRRRLRRARVRPRRVVDRPLDQPGLGVVVADRRRRCPRGRRRGQPRRRARARRRGGGHGRSLAQRQVRRRRPHRGPRLGRRAADRRPAVRADPDRHRARGCGCSPVRRSTT